jgi:hypothetical protein
MLQVREHTLTPSSSVLLSFRFAFEYFNEFGGAYVEEPFVIAQKNELIKKLKEIVQIPPQGPFNKFDIVW